MKITWCGHSCFLLQSEAGSLVFDPYADGSVPGLNPLVLTADRVICSHEHGDHAYTKAVTLTGEKCAFSVTELKSYHDEFKGLKRGKNSMHLVSDGKICVAHLGDLGCKPEDLQLEALRAADVLLLPVGGFYTIGPKYADTLARQLDTRIVIPMHYRTSDYGFDVLNELSDFTALRENVRLYSENSIEIDAATPAQTAILQYRG